ncbi:NAD-glutamate dehydrogenase [Nocardioides limicola]|uniref:NAD-glutamate dehydrogenase n=1 Tax=Nocardioides limicola TaxID=2803368 RepID=UPI0027DDBBD6|nr:NAD-glutamate dehydrogenase [Nocardioides sp. DJM-14]
MHSPLDATKSELIARAAELARQRHGSGGPDLDSVDDLMVAYYRHVSPDDMVERSEADVYGALVSHYRLAGSRPAGTACVRVFTPSVPTDGWSAGGHSVVEVVTDDMPFLVDSVSVLLTQQQRDIYAVIHPQFDVLRDESGELLSMAPAGESVGALRESWMHLEIDRIGEDEDVHALERELLKVLGDVRAAVEDWPAMTDRAAEIVAELRFAPPPVPTEEVEQAAALLEWLADDHFTFLGYREYRLEGEGDDLLLRTVAGSGLGILRAETDESISFSSLPAPVRERARESKVLVLAKANSKATVHRPVYLDYLGVKVFDDAGEVVGERRFLGLFSSAAYTESLSRIPLLREKAEAVMQAAGFTAGSHAGKALMNTLENYPRDELFQAPIEELAPIAQAVTYTRERRALRLFVRRDIYGRYLSCLIYLPLERYNTTVRKKFAELLKQHLGGETVEFTARVNEELTARVHFVVRPPKGQLIGEVDTDDLERRLIEAARSWRDDFLTAVIGEYGETDGARLGRAYADSFPEAYKEDFGARAAAVDLGRLEAIELGPDGTGMDLLLYQPVDAGRDEARLKVFRVGGPLSLSEILPMLSSMGVEVVDERPYELVGLPRTSYIYDFGLRHPTARPAASRGLFTDALQAIWQGRNETDGFNALVLATGLTWRQATLLRAYAKYMRQGGTPFAQDYIEDALRSNADLTRLLVQLFEARFDPTAGGDRAQLTETLTGHIGTALDDVVSLDHDRILRSYLGIITATLRTNYFQRDGAEVKSYISFKLDPSSIADLPEPRPKFEIFVYSPRVEGVHLRFGSVARGGLRWSDRRDDFRTEILGLVKAQMVKNTVIVPVGAKGGFFAKNLPDSSDRDAWLAEGVACYRTFISGLLDVTDNLVDNQVVPPLDVVRHDDDDSYLVVAADKGTATFSDIANSVAADYGFWLGDAFASGGSVGYDHKAMGITARGAWVSVRRHFREMGTDCQREDITVVGIGDMSGDVFGNGMLCSEHIRLVAAFDHRDIFLDPEPDAATSYAERKRLFELPRSSWQDYDTALISEGGGIYSRAAKSIPISAQVRDALGLADDVVRMTPAELMKAILMAPVDLLWNGGIGTYVKASTESHADAGDKANDAIRVDGQDLRVRCVGEGGNLGLTQLGRIEAARAGCRLNTDFIDNSAGVDTSDREVNIKILLDRLVADGDLTGKQRNELLASMTDEVGDLVLRDNYEQNLALANADANSAPLLHVHEDWIRKLVSKGVINRELEGLPDAKEVRRRLDAKEGLSLPELSVLMSWTKIVLAEDLLASDLPDDPFWRSYLYSYFPSQMRHQHRARMDAHPLRREIVVTQVVNELVNCAGITFWPRLSGETGLSAADLTTASFVSREIFGSDELRTEIAAWDNRLDAAVQTRMRMEMRTLVERASRWLVNNRKQPLDAEACVDFFGERVRQVMAQLPEVMTGRELQSFIKRHTRLVAAGVPEELAGQVAVLPPAYMLLGVVDNASTLELDPVEVARTHFAIAERLGLSLLLGRILELPRDDRWQTMARATLRDDLHHVHAQLTAQALTRTDEEDGAQVTKAVDTLHEICSEEQVDLARMSVGLRVVRSLLV